MNLSFYFVFYLVGLIVAIVALGVSVGLAFDLIQPNSYYTATKSLDIIAIIYLSTLVALTLRSWSTSRGVP